MEVMLKDVRLAFPDLWEARQFDGAGEAKFRAIGLIDKSRTDVIAQLEAIIARVVREKWPDPAKAQAMLNAITSNRDKNVVRDGDTRSWQGFPDNWYVAANSKSRPLILDKDKTPLTRDDGRIYPGCYVNMLIDIYPYDNKSRGVSAGLKGLQFVRDGDSFSGSAPASPDAFEDLSVSDADASAFL